MDIYAKHTSMDDTPPNSWHPPAVSGCTNIIFFFFATSCKFGLFHTVRRWREKYWAIHEKLHLAADIITGGSLFGRSIYRRGSRLTILLAKRHGEGYRMVGLLWLPK